MVRSPASGRRCTRRFRSPRPSPPPTANSGAASGPTAAGAASSRRRPRPEALATRSTISVLSGPRGGRRSHALRERSLQIGRPVVFPQQVAKGLVGELLERLHRIAPEQIQRLPGLLIEFHQLAPGIGRPLGHDDLLRWSRRRIIDQRIGTSATVTSTLAAGRDACYPSPMPALIPPLPEAAVHLPARGALIGLDLGTKTIGVAASDPDRRLATAVETIARKTFSADAARLLALAAERQAAAFVLGLPINMDGSEGPRAQSTRAFARNLARLTELPIALWAERLPTAAVERELTAANVPRARRAKVIDQHAAAFILQGALDRLSRGALAPSRH